ncbi:hypothetical protein [Patulibacter defluvii]|uniref:hypothetical protein n=1 Tax=Patulibacter defluvii TaxID=3095358 RepID=UPI002A755336|nr:hypothetical protein [Patulibacter sp. DM4]
MTATWFLPDLWQDYVQEPGRQGIFLVLAAFLGSFVFIRTSARMARSERFPWWPGSVVTDSGVHLHHLVWGIVLMMAGGTLGFALNGQPPWFEVSAVLFGIGVGLTFDEFALWVYLRDVYWAREGRTSIDAVAVTAAFMGLVFLGVNPLQFSGDDVTSTLYSAGYSLLVLTISGICFAKSRFLHGFASFVLPPVGLWAVVRLGKPTSPWARWRYGDRDPRRQQQSLERFGPHRRTARIVEWLRQAVGGVAHPGHEPDALLQREADLSRAREREAAAYRRAADAVRARADAEEQYRAALDDQHGEPADPQLPASGDRG